MSDGPHRSLPLDRRWRRFTEYSGNPAFTADEVRDALKIALEADARRTLPRSLLRSLVAFFTDRQISLDQNAGIERLKHLRTEAGFEFAHDLIDYTILETRSGRQPSLPRAMSRALLGLGASQLRQIEEHCLRHTSPQAQLVPARAAEALRTADVADLVRRLLEVDWAPAPTSLAPKTGLDDGIPLLDGDQ